MWLVYFFFVVLYIYIYKQIQVIHRWIQNSALQLRSGLTVVVYLLLCIYIYIYIYIFSRSCVLICPIFGTPLYEIKKDTTSSFRHVVKHIFNPLEFLQVLLVILPVSVLSLDEWSPILSTCLFVFQCFNVQQFVSDEGSTQL